MDKNYIKFKALYYYSEEDKTYYADIPGFDSLFTEAKDLEELTTNLIDIMVLTIKDYIDDNEDYTNLLRENNKTIAENGENTLIISIYLPYEFSKVKEIYKNKTVTLPVWLEMLAKQKNLNFSKVLVDGLKKELNIK